MLKRAAERRKDVAKLLLVDLSSLFVPIYKMSAAEADPDYASKATVARVHEMASGFEGVAVCCDSRKSWRKELCPEYKAQRPAQEEPLYHQLRLAKEQLAADGFPMWEAEGFEADDCIGAAVTWLDAEGFDGNVVVVSSDKDLACLAGPSVAIKSLRSGDMMGPDGVFAKFGVRPDQMADWLVLVGDASDNISGVKGIGAKRATELLQKHGTLAHIYANLGDSGAALGLTPSVFTALKESVHICEMARKLITLRTDVELPFQDIFKPRVATKRAEPAWAKEEDMALVTDALTGEVVGTTGPEETPAPKPPEQKKASGTIGSSKSVELVRVDWNHSLEPANLSQAMTLATALHASRLFQAYGSPEAVLAVILAGREFGIGAMSSLKGFHIIEGKPSMSADLMAAIVKRSPLCKQFEIIERTAERATIRIWRTGEAEAFQFSYSVDDAKRAKLVKAGGNWEKDPAGMCVSRCKAIGARLKWEDLIGNVYTPEEMGREDLEEAA